jgi:hypothetical protein
MLTVSAWCTLSRTAVLNKTVVTLRLARSLASSENFPTAATGTCWLAGVESCRGRQKGEIRPCRLQVVSDDSCTSCVRAGIAVQTTKKRCHGIVHRKWASFGTHMPHSWRTADQSWIQSNYDPRHAQNSLERAKKNARESKMNRTAKKRKKR